MMLPTLRSRRSAVPPVMLALGLVVAAAAPAVAQDPEPRDTVSADTLRPIELRPLDVVRVRSRLPETAYAVSAIGRDDIGRGRATFGLDESLVSVPGVFVANRYNPSLDQRVSIRGFGARSAFGVRGIKVMLDGIPQTLPDGQGQLTNIELSEVESIEVLRGASSSLYGNAAGGVIDIRTSRAPLTRVRPHLSAVAGAFGTTKWSAGVAAPLPDGDVSVSISRTESDGYRAHSASDVRQFRLRWRQRLTDATELTVHAHVADNPVLDNPGALTESQVQGDPSQADPRNVAADAGKDLAQVQAGASLVHRFRSGASVQGSVFGLRRDLINPLTFAYIDLDRWAWGARAAGSFPVRLGSLQPTVTLGIDAQWQRDDRLNQDPDRTSLTLDQLERVTEVGPFVQATIRPVERISWSVGARWDRIEFEAEDQLFDDGDDSGRRVLSAVSWNTGVTVAVAPTFQPYGTVGTAFETPTTTELTNRPDGQGGFNDDLEPQRATNLEVGARGVLGGRWRYGLALFHTWVTDELIPFEVPTQPSRRFFRNAGSAFHRGIEVDVAGSLGGGFSVRGAYTYANHAFDDFETETAVFDGNELPGVPRHVLYVSAEYRGPQGFWLAVDETHNSSYYVNDANTTENAGWWVTGVRAGWEGAVGAVAIAPYIGVLNVFDEGYAGSVVVNAFGGRFFEPAPRRNAYLGVTLRPI